VHGEQQRGHYASVEGAGGVLLHDDLGRQLIEGPR
jgi:hypothetical protein